MDWIETAHSFAASAHRDQERKFTGRPYLEHLEETAQIFWQVTDGESESDAYIAAVLHDTVEDTNVTIEEVKRVFGDKVASLVDELTIDEVQKQKEGKKVYLARRLNEMTDTALSIKLSDRLSNVIGLENEKIPTNFVKWYIKETLYILEHLDRHLNEVHEELIDRLNKMILYLKIDRKI